MRTYVTKEKLSEGGTIIKDPRDKYPNPRKVTGRP